MSTVPLRSAMGRVDARSIIVARCYGHSPVRYHSSIQTERLNHVVAVTKTGHVEWFDTGGDFWQWLDTCSRSILLVVGDADRDMAMLGIPAGWVSKRTIGHDSTIPRTYYAQLRQGERINGKGWRRRLDIAQIGNWHHEQTYAGSLGIKDMYEWLSAWVDTIHTNGLGPKIEWTIARQALLSLKRYAHTYDDGGLWWHDNHQLHRFEYATRREQSPIRIGANDAHYDRLYKLDFTAHYLSVLASCPMPGELVAYEPNGCTVADMQWILRHGLLVVADVRTSHGWRKMTTPEVANSDYDAVREMAAYRPTRLLAGWAANMYRIREECDPIIRQSIKALGVSLWGRLTARNYTFVPKSHIYEPGEETLYGLGPVTDGDMSYRFTDNGRYFECDPGAWHRERFHALGAHVMAYGRQRVERLMGLVEPVYCHTDSIWSLTPVTGTAAMPRGLGGVTQEIVHDVTFSAGVRYVGGVVDAAPGIPRRGSRRYQPHTDPELLDMDATAAFEIRR